MSKEDVMLVSPNYVKSISYLTNNVDEDILGASIREAQSIYLQGIVGKALLDRIKELVYNKIVGSGETIDTKTEYKALLDNYIQPYLASKSLVCALMPLTFKLRNIGVSKNSDTNINTVTYDELMAAINYYNTSESEYATRLSAQLDENTFVELKNAKDAKINKPFANTNLWLGNPALPKCKCR